MTPQTGLTSGVDGVGDSCAPAKSRRCDLLDLTGPLDPGQSLELFAYDITQQHPLHRRIHVLEIATAALSRIDARRGNPAGSRLDDLDGVCPQERPAAVGDPDAHALPRHRVAHEHDLTVDSRDAVTSVRHRPDLDDDVLHDQRPLNPRRTSPGAECSRPKRRFAMPADSSW